MFAAIRQIYCTYSKKPTVERKGAAISCQSCDTTRASLFLAVRRQFIWLGPGLMCLAKPFGEKTADKAWETKSQLNAGADSPLSECHELPNWAMQSPAHPQITANRMLTEQPTLHSPAGMREMLFPPPSQVLSGKINWIWRHAAQVTSD